MDLLIGFLLGMVVVLVWWYVEALVNEEEE